MDKNYVNTLAAQLEDIASRMSRKSALPCDSRYIGLETAAVKAIEQLLTAMFPDHLGQVHEHFSKEENRTWELMRAFNALTSALGYVCDDFETAEQQASQVISALPEILAVLETDIMAAYPWLKGEAIALDERFRLLDSPLARILLKKATILDASKRTGYPVQEIIAEINKMVDKHIA